MAYSIKYKQKMMRPKNSPENIQKLKIKKIINKNTKLPKLSLDLPKRKPKSKETSPFNEFSNSIPYFKILKPIERHRNEYEKAIQMLLGTVISAPTLFDKPPVQNQKPSSTAFQKLNKQEESLEKSLFSLNRRIAKKHVYSNK